METTKVPYELLIRWDQDGNLAGAHVQYRYVIRDGAKIIGESVSQAVPILPDTACAFPLASVMSEAEVSALAATNVAKIEIDRLNGIVADRDDQIAKLTHELQDKAT